jgi:hypothetical protein
MKKIVIITKYVSGISGLGARWVGIRLGENERRKEPTLL